MDLSQALATFFEESRDLLTQMEEILLRAEGAALDADDMNALFRCAHTIKGSAGMFGLDPVVHFTHDVENALDRLRRGELEFSADLANLLLESRDHISSLLTSLEAGNAFDGQDREEALLDRLRKLSNGAAENAGVAGVAVVGSVVAESLPEATLETGEGQHLGNDNWHISLRFTPEILQYGFDPLAMIQYMKNYGDIVHLETVADALPDLHSADAELCYVGFEIAFRSAATKADIEGVFEFIQEHSQIFILPPHSRIDEFIALIDSADEAKLRLGDLLISCGSLTEKELALALESQKKMADSPKLGEVLLERNVVQAPIIEAALGKQKKVEEKRANEAKSVKVPADRLDALIDQVGELVIAGAATQLHAKKALNRELQEVASNLIRLVEDVRDTALRLRMTPIGEVFSRFPRVVRDVSKELGKDIELKISGAEAELDKSMIEKIGDPLMHLVRNSIDHGIESPERRAAAGKPARGTVSLNAFHESGSIVIEVADDGGGLDQGRIFAKAVERGLASAEANLSPAEIYRLILEPGFSTAEQVTNLSGRGVGMDVVKSNVEALRGSLDIDSVPGQGTTMRICLPLTLAIIDGFQIGVGSSVFILPLDAVVECIELPAGADVAEYLNLRGEVLPFLRLRQLFSVSGEVPIRQNIVVVRFAGRKAGIAVDRLFGECQTVIKPLGTLFAGISGISGSTILGSGEVALILDVSQLVQHAVSNEAKLGGPASRARIAQS
jgi:two-component system chemotaxis sensor kinase CheA